MLFVIIFSSFQFYEIIYEFQRSRTVAKLIENEKCNKVSFTSDNLQ